jgi:hypothetical protein
MTSKQRARAAAKALRARSKKAPARKLADYDSKEGPNDEPDPVEEEPNPRFDNGPEPAEGERAILTPKDDTALRTRVVDDGSAGQTAAKAVARKKANAKAAGQFARNQLRKAGLSTGGSDEAVAARFREANHAVAQRRTDEGLQRAKSIGASSALAANKANSKAQLEAQERARAKATSAKAAITARAKASASVAKTVTAAKARAKAAVSSQRAQIVTQITGRPPAGTRVSTPTPARPAPKPVAPKKKPVKKVGGGRHLT